jgi:hypothetical protein
MAKHSASSLQIPAPWVLAHFTVNLSLTGTAGHLLWQLSMGMNPAQVNLAAVQSSALNVVVQKM